MGLSVLLLLAFSWGTNTCLNLLGHFKRKFPALRNLDTPTDAQLMFFDRQRLLGDSTTVLGALVAPLSGILIGISLGLSMPLGATAGICVYLGHACGSFIKRRLKIKPGDYVPILDHTDSVIMLGIVYYYLGMLSLQSIVIAAITSALLQPLLCYIGYRLRLRERPL